MVLIILRQCNIHPYFAYSRSPNTIEEHSINLHCNQLHNPVYDGTHSQTNYSSPGPAYEHVKTNKGTGYDVINRRRAHIPQQSLTPPGSRDSTLGHDYNTLKGNNHNVPESSNMTDEVDRNGRVGTRNDQEERRQNLQLSLHINDPQEYETPTPQNQ